MAIPRISKPRVKMPHVKIAMPAMKKIRITTSAPRMSTTIKRVRSGR